MPRRKSIEIAKAQQNTQSIFNQLRWGESYTSLLLGIIVVIVGVLLTVSFIRNRSVQERITQQVSSDKTENVEKTKPTANTVDASMYTVVQGDTLWSIAEKSYKTGYAWRDIASANKIEDPTLLEEGTKLTIPKVDPQIIATEIQESLPAPPQKITVDTYTIAKDDTLWDIAVRAYGDGFRWTEIAQANNLVNPDLIFSGNTLTLPRS